MPFMSPWDALNPVRNPQDREAVRQLMAAQNSGPAPTQQAISNSTPLVQGQGGGGGGGGGGYMVNDPYADYRKKIMDELNKSQDSLEALRGQQGKQRPDQYSAALENALERSQGKETQTDLSPLLALMDNWYGGDMSSKLKGFYNPYTEDKKANEIAALEQAIGKRGSAISDAEAKALNDAIKSEGYIQQTLGSQLKALMPQVESKSASIQGDRLSQQRKDKYESTFGKKYRGLTQLGKQVNDATGILKKNAGLPSFGSDDRKMLASKVSQILTSYNRDYAELGALAGDDLKLLKQAIALSPSEFENTLGEMMYGPKAAQKVLTAIAQDMRQVMEQQKGYVSKMWDGGADHLLQDQIDTFDAVTQSGKGTKPTGNSIQSAAQAAIMRRAKARK